MGFWKKLARKMGKSLGLLGKPYLIDNRNYTFGSSPVYWAIQLEWPETYDETKLEGEEIVILLTPHELERVISRAAKNPEDVISFLEKHAIQDSID